MWSSKVIGFGNKPRHLASVKRQRKEGRQRRLLLEPLEERRLLAVITANQIQSIQSDPVAPAAGSQANGLPSSPSGDGQPGGDFVARVTVDSRPALPASQNKVSTIGLYNPTTSVFQLRNTNDAGDPDATFGYGPINGGWITIAGDWDGDGVDTIGLYNPATSVFYLRNSNDSGYAHVTFTYGPANSGWTPIAGDWDGDGVDTIGLYDPTTSVFYLRNANDTGYAETTFAYGPVNGGWTPIAGDWDGDGKDTVGLYNPTTSVFYLRNTNNGGYANATFPYGPAGGGWKPMAGDWDGDGKDSIGLYNPATSGFFLRNSNDTGYANVHFNYGPANGGWLPIVGDWNGAGGALMAEGGPTTNSQNIPALTQADLQPIITEAIARWASAGLDAATVAKLKQIQFVIRDLPGSYLEEAGTVLIYLDRTAAEHGWFVDPTPAADEEFSWSQVGERLLAIDPRAVDRIDLLTVVEHELGHIAGLSDLDAVTENLMSNVLGTGARRNPN